MCAIASSRLATTFTRQHQPEYSVDQSAALAALATRRGTGGWNRPRSSTPAQ